jgi:hypothetical protein
MYAPRCMYGRGPCRDADALCIGGAADIAGIETVTAYHVGTRLVCEVCTARASVPVLLPIC